MENHVDNNMESDMDTEITGLVGVYSISCAKAIDFSKLPLV